MKTSRRVFVGYAAGKGQAAAIAAHVAAHLRARGHFVFLLDIARAPSSLDPLHGCEAVILIASTNDRRCEPELVTFVTQNVELISAWPSALISVSPAQTTAESQLASPEARTMAHPEAQAMTDQFIHDTGWQPGLVRAAAGALDHSKHSLVERCAYTKWPRMDAVADELERYFVSCSCPTEWSILPQVRSDRDPGRHRLTSSRS